MLSFFGLLPVGPDSQRSTSLVLVFAALLFVFLVHCLVELRVIIDVVEVLLLRSTSRLALSQRKCPPHAVIDLHKAMLLRHLQLRLISAEAVRL